MLEENYEQIQQVIRAYDPDSSLSVFEGMRKTLPADCFPSFEIEPGDGSTEWATTRSQRPRYTFMCTLTVMNDNEDYGVEYIASIATILAELLTDPQNLQMRILNESKWDPNGGLVDTHILDSFAESVSYSASKDGTIRTAEFSYWAMVHEPFPESKWAIGDMSMPTIIRPKLVEVPS
jgi:hypothetical protein